MKTVCSILVLALAIHSQCGVQCLSAAVPVEKPPCHQQDDTPDPNHHGGSSCGQSQVVEFKISALLKGTLEWTAIRAEIESLDMSPLVPQMTSGISADVFSPGVYRTSPPILRI
jgi:hypothetical protein